MLVLAGSVDEHRFAVEEETTVAVLAMAWPRDGADAERCRYLVSGLAVALYHAGKSVEIRILRTPQDWVADSSSLMYNLRLARSNGDVLYKAEHLLAAGEHELIDHVDGGGGGAVVVNLGIDEHGVCTVVVPDMYAKRFDAHLVGLDETDRTEDA